MKQPFSGSCACGGVRYHCETAPVAMLNCHCRDCQRSSGAPYASGFVVSVKGIEIVGTTSSYSTVTDEGSVVTRMFCPTCGSPMFATSDRAEGFMSVRFSTLDDPSSFSPQMDVWTSSAQPWTCMNGALPKFNRETQ
jgi:hypothetical protein